MKTKYLFIAMSVIMAFCFQSASAQNQLMKPVEVLNLYDGPAPESESWTHHEVWSDAGKSDGFNVSEGATVYNVVKPTIAVYLPAPEKATGSAMVVCPGGGFYMLSYDNEGVKVAERLCEQGIAAFVLKYRTTPVLDAQGNTEEDPKKMGEMTFKLVFEAVMGEEAVTKRCLDMPYSHLAFIDADRAVTFVRENADKWGINPDKIGVMGFSAGAVTSMHQALVHSEKSKPNFSAIIYGGWTSDVVAPADAAPLFLCSPRKDVFKPFETQDVYNAWLKKDLPVELHYYSTADHGFGGYERGRSSDLWFNQMIHFMQDVGFIEKSNVLLGGSLF